MPNIKMEVQKPIPSIKAGNIENNKMYYLIKDQMHEKKKQKTKTRKHKNGRSANISVTAININGLKPPTKSKRSSKQNKTNPIKCCL